MNHREENETRGTWSSGIAQKQGLQASVLLVWSVLIVSLGLRILHYWRCPPVWCDELWLLGNIIDRNFVEHLGTLTNAQAAPPLFMWAERTMWLMFGDNIYLLRLLPVLASCGTLLLLVPLGRKLMGWGGVFWGVLLLGTSNHICYDYTCEVKPYVCDMFWAAAIALLFCLTAQWRQGSRFALFAALAPVVIFSSYVGGFIYGGVLVAFAMVYWHQRDRWPIRVNYVILASIVAVAFGLLVLGPARAQRTPELCSMYATKFFPDWRHPWTVPYWSFDTLERFLEHVWRPTGGLLIVPAVLGAVGLWRKQRRVELALLTVPVGLAMLAACIGAFPFESRMVLFAAVPFSLLIGLGLRIITSWLYQGLCRDSNLTTSRRWVLHACTGAVCLCLLLPLSRTVCCVISPWPRLTVEKWPRMASSVDTRTASSEPWTCIR